MTTQKGFTLIELLIVVLVIGILAAIAIPVFNGQRAKAKNSVAKSDLRNGVTAAESYYAANQTYLGFDLPEQESSLQKITDGNAWTQSPGSQAESGKLRIHVYNTDSTAPGQCIFLASLSKGNRAYAAAACKESSSFSQYSATQTNPLPAGIYYGSSTTSMALATSDLLSNRYQSPQE